MPDCKAAVSHYVKHMAFARCPLLIRMLIVVGTLSGLPGRVAAVESGLEDGLRRCAALSADAERLACFDGLARSRAAPGNGPSLGRWTIRSETLSGGALATIAEQRPVEPWTDESILLRIACRDGRVSVAVGRDNPVVNGSGVLTSVRIDDRLVPGDIWTAAPDYRSALYPGDAQAWLRGLPASGRLSIQLEGSRRWRFEGTFALDGLDEVRGRVLAACRR